MSETVKERIKRKKKERAEALLNNKVEEPSNAIASLPLKTQPQADKNKAKLTTKGTVEVLGIYPVSQPKKKFVVQGNVSIKMHQLGFELRNIPYGINKENNVRVHPPFRYHKFPEDPEKPDAYVETIKFDDASLWEVACEVIRAAVLEHHKEELSIKE